MKLQVNLRLMTLTLAMAALLLAAMIGCQAADSEPAAVGTTATATMRGPGGADMGTVTLTQGPQGALVMADLSGLEPGAHGFHIHEVGTCSPDFSAAGDHFTLEGVEHGYMNSGGQHLGDMPNIYADSATGRPAPTFSTPQLPWLKAPTTPYSIPTARQSSSTKREILTARTPAPAAG